MLELGYSLSSEEQSASQLVRRASLAENAGFRFALISDHFHLWLDRQGNSPFVWSVLGAIAEATERLVVGTGVTCPLIRIHPAIIAQAAATTASLMPGRFFLGVGTGENLNEHILGDRWPPVDDRLEMLEEAVEIIRLLWRGELISYHGCYYDVENARLYTLPETPPPIMVAASGPKSATLAGQLADGLIAVSPEREVVAAFDEAGGAGKPRYGQIGVCYAPDKAQAVKTAHEWWPLTAIRGQAGQELPLPSHFEQLSSLVREEDVERIVPCGPDVDHYIDAIKKYADAGFDHVYLHQIGPDQESFLAFCQRDLAPAIARIWPKPHLG